MTSFRRRDFIQSFYGRLQGLRQLPPERRFGAAGYDQNPRYEVVDRVTAPGGLRIVTEIHYLKQITTRPVKVCVPGPMTLALPLILKSGYPDRDLLLEDIAGIINAEMKALVAAGADYVQIDEPRYATSREDAQQLVELFNTTHQGVSARIGLHLCFGNFKGRSRDRRHYAPLFPALTEAQCDQFNLEFANREFAQIELLRHFGPGQKIGVGVVDIKSYFVETSEEVAASIRLALQHAPGATGANNPHGIENCSTIPNTINEMMLLSHENILRFFRVWPRENHPEARFTDLRACGAFKVSASLERGVVGSIRIESLKGRDCTVENPWPGGIARLVRGDGTEEEMAGARFTFPTRPGEVLVIRPK